MFKRIHIDQCPVDCLEENETAEYLYEKIQNRQRCHVAPVNAAVVVMASRHPDFREILQGMDLLLPDGFWLQTASRLCRLPSPHHVATVPLTYKLLRRMAPQGARVYLLGATDEVVNGAAREITRRFPGIQIAGFHNGYFTELEEKQIVQNLNETHPGLLLIGISSPKRELFMTRNRNALAVPVVIGVGGLLDILGGKTSEGPQWLRRIGMMWLFRFIQEPRRMWQRAIMLSGEFVWLVLKQAVRPAPLSSLK
ncbi:MAG: WecB/TagA/CpsF family glycosyltransferase [bacterium]